MDNINKNGYKKMKGKYGDGTIHTNNQGERFIVLGGCQNDNEYRYVKFFEHKMQYIKRVSIASIIGGFCKNPYYKSVCGVGYPGEKYNSKHQLYRTWQKVIRRCYDPKNNRYNLYGAIGVRVHEDWHNFSTFVDDMLYGYVEGSELIQQFRMLGISTRDLQLDKDINAIERTPEGKGLLYSKDTVKIVTMQENMVEMYQRLKKNK